MFQIVINVIKDIVDTVKTIIRNFIINVKNVHEYFVTCTMNNAQNVKTFIVRNVNLKYSLWRCVLTVLILIDFKLMNRQFNRIIIQ
jgi:phage-related protein